MPRCKNSGLKHVWPSSFPYIANDSSKPTTYNKICYDNQSSADAGNGPARSWCALERTPGITDEIRRGVGYMC